MADADTKRPTEQELWAGPHGQTWLANAQALEATLQPFGEELLNRAALMPGEQVVDVGCGAGAMSLEIARRVGPSGSVTGLDISQVLVAEAQHRATAAGLANLRFLCTNAAESGLPAGKADCLVSRFGIMFFADPYAAFRNLRTLLRSNGRLAIACWQPVKANPMMQTLRQVLAAHMEMPEPPPRSPGPWAFEDPEYVREILNKAEFKQVAIQPWQSDMYIGGRGSNVRDGVHYMTHSVLAAQKLATVSEDVRKQVETKLADRMQAFATPEGVRVPGAIWIATARA